MKRLAHIVVSMVSAALVASCSVNAAQAPRSSPSPAVTPSADSTPTDVAPVVLEGDCPLVPVEVVEQTQNAFRTAAEANATDLSLTFDESDEVREHMGRRRGLTFHRDPEAVARLEHEVEQAYAGRPRMTIDEFAAAANRFSRELGVTVAIPQGTDAPEAIMWHDSGEPVDLSQLSADQIAEVKHSLVSIVKALAAYPVELLRLAAVTDVVLIDLRVEDVSGASVMGEGLIMMDALGGMSTWVLAHELTHLLDAELCGFSENDNGDPGFESLNPGDIYRHGRSRAQVKIGATRYFSEEALHSDNKRARAFGAEIDRDGRAWRSMVSSPHEREDAKSRLQDAREQIVVLENYSFTHLEEDKATLGSWLLDGDESMSSRQVDIGPVDPIAEKIVYFTARIMQKAPDIAEYLIDVNTCLDWNNLDLDAHYVC